MPQDPAKQRLFWIALAAIPVLFFALIELGLRVGRYGANLDLFVRADWQGQRLYAMNRDVVRRYFRDPDFGTYVSRDRFAVEKPQGTYRIFCLGASTTIGFPYMFNGSYSSLLEDRLEALLPDRPVEIINAGVTAVNSFTVTEFAREVMKYEPDLLIVYMGHNEFYGALGIGSSEFVARNPRLIRLYLRLQRLKVFQLLRDGLMTVAGTGQEEGEGRQLIERMVRERQIPADSPAHETARRYFTDNYREVIRTAKRHGVDLLISTLASNLRDQPPFVSVHVEGTTAEAQAEWAQHFERGKALAAAGDCPGAISAFRDAIELDGARADAHYELARCLEASGHAADAYRRARDLDALPFRARSDFNDVIRSLADEGDVPLVDMEAAFAERAPQGIPGGTLFWEHVHPTFDGYMLMADALADAMHRHGLIAPPGERAWERNRPDSLYRSLAGVTRFDHEVAGIRIELLKSGWPFREQARTVDYEPVGPVQELAWDYIRGRIGWAAARDRLARAYLDEGDEEGAAREYWALARVSDYDPHYANLAGSLFARRKRHAEAAVAFKQALRSEESPTAHARLGVIYSEAQAFPEAIRHIERACALDPPAQPRLQPPLRAQLRFLLGTAYLRTGDEDAAQHQLRELEALAPMAPQTAALRSALRSSH